MSVQRRSGNDDPPFAKAYAPEIMDSRLTAAQVRLLLYLRGKAFAGATSQGWRRAALELEVSLSKIEKDSRVLRKLGFLSTKKRCWGGNATKKMHDPAELYATTVWSFGGWIDLISGELTETKVRTMRSVGVDKEIKTYIDNANITNTVPAYGSYRESDPDKNQNQKQKPRVARSPRSLREPGAQLPKTKKEEVGEEDVDGVRAFVDPTNPKVRRDSWPAPPSQVASGSASPSGLPVERSNPPTREEIAAERQRRRDELLREIHGDPAPAPAPPPKPIPPDRRLPREDDDVSASADVVFVRRPWTEHASWWDAWHDFEATWDRFVAATNPPEALVALGREEHQVRTKCAAAGYPLQPMRFRAIRRNGGKGEVYGLKIAIGAKGKRLTHHRYILQPDGTAKHYDDAPIVTDGARLARLFPDAAAIVSIDGVMVDTYQYRLTLLAAVLAKDYDYESPRLRRARRLERLLDQPEGN